MRSYVFAVRAAVATTALALAAGCAGSGGGNTPPVAVPAGVLAGFAPSLASPAEIANAPMSLLEEGRLHDASSCSGSDVVHTPPTEPSAKVASKGTLFVSDSSNPGVIEEFKADGSSNTPVGSITGGSSIPMVTPDGVGVDKSGTLYVADNNPNNVLEFPQGASVPTTSLTYQVLAPLTVGIDPSQNIYVVNDRGGPIVIFPPGQTMPSSELGGFYYPTDVAWDSKGNLYVVDELHPSTPRPGAVIRFAPGKTKGVDLKLKGLSYPVGIAVDKSDDIIVSNLGNNSITEYATGATTSKRTITSGVCDPVHMVLNSITDLFVAEAGTNTVNMYKPLLKTPTVTLSGKELKAVRGVTINPNLNP